MLVRGLATAERLRTRTWDVIAVQPGMDSFPKQDSSRCAARTDSPTALVREESCFPMVELGEALDIVGDEIRTAVHIRLQQLSYSRTSPVATPECRKNTSQLLHHMDLSEDEESAGKVTTTIQSTSGEETEEGSNRRDVGADSAAVEDSVVETVGPPFLGRRVGSPNGVSAPFPLPPFRASLVDGYALHIPSGKWCEVQELYKSTTLRRSVGPRTNHDREDRVALKIIGEVRAGADLTCDGVQPFRGHPHIWEESGGPEPNETRARFYLKNRVHHAERVKEALHEEVPTSLKCVYVTTGSPVPRCCNAVVPVESCEVDVESCLCWPDHEAVSELTGDGENIREVGADAQAESLLLQQGQLVGPAEEGLLAAIGLERLEVFRKLTVHTLTLGDELQSRGAPGTLRKEVLSSDLQSESVYFRDKAHAGKPCGNVMSLKVKQNPVSAAHQKQTTSGAVYDSNSPMLRALLSQHCPSINVGQHHALPDEVDQVQRLLLALALGDATLSPYVAECSQKRRLSTGCADRAVRYGCTDVLVSTGGVSMGGSDCMKLALLQLQRKTLQHRLCLHTSARCRERFKKRKRQPGAGYAEAERVATSNSRDDTTLSRESRLALSGSQAHCGRETATSFDPVVELRAPRDWSNTIETEIKFGRLNVKPGKPAMFAVLRVFRRQEGEEVDRVEEAKQQNLHGGVNDAAAAQQAQSKDQTILSRSHASSHANLRTPNWGSGSASSHSKQPVSSSGILRHKTRRPERTLFVFALPGNPCSVWVLFHLLVAPSINYYSSFCLSTSLSTHVPAQTFAILDESVVPDSTRPEYHRALVYVGGSDTKAGASDSGELPPSQECRSLVRGWTAFARAALQLYAFPTGIQTSSRLLSCCASANGLVLVTPSKVSKRVCIRAGETVPVLLCGPPFPVRPEALINLVRLQNKQSSFHKTTCKCGGGMESSVHAFTPNPKDPLSASELVARMDEVETKVASCDVTSLNRLTDATGFRAFHFERRQPPREPVNLGIVIVSDRCSRGDMQDICADTLLSVLQESSAVAALLRLRSQREHPGYVLQNSMPLVRAEDDTGVVNGRAPELVRKPCIQTRIVPDQIERIQEAVLSMMCSCVHDPEKSLGTDADRPISRRSLIFVCGGTGISPRDVTPQAILPLFTLRCSGIEHLLLEYSLRCTVLAALGRPCAGVIECGAGRQMRQRNVTKCSAGRGKGSLAVDKRASTPTPDEVCNLSRECCTCGVSHAGDPRSFTSVMVDKCCRPRGAHALRSLRGRKGTPTHQDSPSVEKHDAVAQEPRGSTTAPPESGAPGALETAERHRVEVSRQRGGCGARCMVVVFPGSPKAVRENATALLPVLPHALEQL